MQKKSLFSLSVILLFSLVGCDKSVHIKNSEQSENHSVIVQNNINTDNKDNKTTVTILEENNSYNTNYSHDSKVVQLSSGQGNIVITDNGAYVDGKEIDVKQTKSISVSYFGDKKTTEVNGQPVKYKNNADNQNITINDKNITVNDKNITINITGNVVKFPVKDISTLNSSIPITQQCSNNKENYLLIDSALVPYLYKDTENGFIHLKNGHYTIKGIFSAVLFTQPLNYLENQGTSTLTLSCIDKSTFNIENTGSSNVSVSNINNDTIKINQQGIGKINLEGTLIHHLYVNNQGVGHVNIDVPVLNGQIENSGLGIISARSIDTVDVTNEGIGSINIEKSKKTVQSINSGLGSIHIVK